LRNDTKAVFRKFCTGFVYIESYRVASKMSSSIW